VGAKLFHADGQTDVTKVILALRNYANKHKTFWNSAQCQISRRNIFCVCAAVEMSLLLLAQNAFRWPEEKCYLSLPFSAYLRNSLGSLQIYFWDLALGLTGFSSENIQRVLN